MIYLLAEVHGVRENAIALKHFVDEKNVKNIYLEYFPNMEQEIQNFVYKGASLKSKKILDLSEDGRIYAELLIALRELYLNKLISAVFCYSKSEGKGDWNKREQDYLKAFEERFNPEESAIVVMGNLHAKREQFDLEGKSVTPFGKLLDEKYETKVIRLNYEGGGFYNFGVNKFTNYKDKLERFEEEYTIKNATPVSKKDLEELYE